MKAAAMPAPQVPWALVAWQRTVLEGAAKRETERWETVRWVWFWSAESDEDFVEGVFAFCVAAS